VNDSHITKLNLTPDSSDWDPHDTKYVELEATMLDYKGEMCGAHEQPVHTLLAVNKSESTATLRGVNRCLDVNLFAHDLQEVVSVHSKNESQWTVAIQGVVKSSKCGTVTAEELSKRIGLEAAKRTLGVCTQLAVRTDDPTLHKRFSSNDRMLRYNRISIPVFTDTFFTSKPDQKGNRGGTRSLRGFACVQVFVTEDNHTHVVSMSKKDNLPFAVKDYFKSVGVPSALVCDPTKEQILGETRRLCEQASCDIHPLEKGAKFANRAVCQDRKSNCPMNLWCYCLQRRCEINNATAAGNPALQGTNPHTRMTGQKYDISNLCQFGWYEWVYFRDEKRNDFLIQSQALEDVPMGIEYQWKGAMCSDPLKAHKG
jgi:hypothetical protein